MGGAGVTRVSYVNKNLFIPPRGPIGTQSVVCLQMQALGGGGVGGLGVGGWGVGAEGIEGGVGEGLVLVSFVDMDSKMNHRLIIVG